MGSGCVFLIHLFSRQQAVPATAMKMCDSYVFVCSQHFPQSGNRLGLVFDTTFGQINKGYKFSLRPFAPENLISRLRFGCPVSGQPGRAFLPPG